MLSAKEARIESENVVEEKRTMRERKEEREKRKVERKIARAIRKGHNNCGIFDLSTSTIEWLKTLGYTVSEERYDGILYEDAYWWVIRW